MTKRYRSWDLARFQSRQMRDHGFACYNWWRREDPGTFWLYRFLQRPRVAGRAANVRFAFCSVFGDRRVAENSPGDLRIFFTGENLSFYPEYADHLLPSVDLALGFDSLSAPNYLRFPLWLLMCFPPDGTLAEINSILDRWRSASENLPERPAAVASLVARHDAGGIRAAIAARFCRHGTVRFGGAFGNAGGAVIGPDWDDKLNFLRGSPFNICPENSDRRGYVTEKVFHAIGTGCVPLYWGSEGQPEPDILNPDALIHFDPLVPEQFDEQISLLLHDTNELEQFGRQDRFLPGSAQEIYGYYRRLENRLLELMY